MTATGKTTIHLLDPLIVNQIAAGEVVERPASVVKELVENAIDADATTIRIMVTTTREGIATIRVSDDGYGMSPDDAALAFVPHATSKIRSLEDLHSTMTLGFRGEALATIASVARVTLMTKERGSGSEPGTCIVIEGGNVKERKDVGAPEGTSIIVNDLFYNTPARKKFQKSRTTELAHIHEIMEGICFAHPEIAFHLNQDGSDLLVTDRTGLSLDTITRLFGTEVSGDLIELKFGHMFVSGNGYISRPSLSRKDRTRMIISVNGRFISSPAINDAIKSGYGTLLPKDRFPMVFLNLQINPDLVDINVHPTKKQIRLQQQGEITGTIRTAIKKELLAQDLIPSAADPRIHTINDIRHAPAHEHARYRHTSYNSPPEVYECSHAGSVSTDERLRQTELMMDSEYGEISRLLPDIEFIGSFGGIYILGRTPDDELMVIDQHAAHERILYEQVSECSFYSSQVQELITPIVLHRNPKEMTLIRGLLPDLAAEGFDLEEFGTGSFIMRAVPVILGRITDPAALDDLVSELISDEKALIVSPRERILRVIACRGAVKAGTVCSPEQCRRIIQQLSRTRNPFTCPHGRPTIIRFSRKDLDGMFQRI